MFRVCLKKTASNEPMTLIILHLNSCFEHRLINNITILIYICIVMQGDIILLQQLNPVEVFQELQEDEEPCYGKKCTANEHCCPGSVCVDVDGSEYKI